MEFIEINMESDDEKTYSLSVGLRRIPKVYHPGEPENDNY